MIVNCTICGIEIKRNQNNSGIYFCSNKCKKIYRTKDRIKTTCDNCGKEISITKSRFENSDNHYCSKECGWNSLKIGRVEISCRYCDKSLYIIPSLVGGRENHFCNQDCYWNWLEGQKRKKISNVELLELYGNKSYNELSKYFNCSIGTIKRRLEDNNIKLRNDRTSGFNSNGTNKHGYTFKSIYTYPKEYHNILNPMLFENSLQIAEHRAEMAIYLNLPLNSDEIIHHKNGVKTDNRISNLQIVTRSNHIGEVKCPYCQNIFGIK